MRRFHILKAFATNIHRFVAGETVDETDIESIDIDHLLGIDFIEEVKAAPAPDHAEPDPPATG